LGYSFRLHEIFVFESDALALQGDLQQRGFLPIRSNTSYATRLIIRAPRRVVILVDTGARSPSASSLRPSPALINSGTFCHRADFRAAIRPPLLRWPPPCSGPVKCRNPPPPSRNRDPHGSFPTPRHRICRAVLFMVTRAGINRMSSGPASPASGSAGKRVSPRPEQHVQEIPRIASGRCPDRCTGMPSVCR